MYLYMSRDASKGFNYQRYYALYEILKNINNDALLIIHQ
jgi:hypothetical protein